MQIQSWVKWIKGSIIVLVCSLPVIIPFLVSSNLLFPYITGKNFYFRLIAELAFGGWAILAIISPKYRIKVSPLVWAMLAFTIVIGVADYFGENFTKSFWSNNERMEGWITILHLAALFVAVAHTFSEKLWLRFVQVSLGISALVAIQGFVDLGQSNMRIDGSFGNSTYLGVYALIHVFFALFFIVRELFSVHEGKQMRYEHVTSYSILAILNIITLYFTGTRGSLLGLAGGISVVALIYVIRERKHPVLRKVAFALLGLELLATAFLFSIHGTEFVSRHSLLERFSNLVTAIVTFDLKTIATIGDARFNIWGVALEGVKERPLLGWGQENFTYVFSKYYDPALYDQEQWFDRTHNVFFDWLIAGGLLGLLSYLSLFVAIMYMLWKNKNKSFSSVEQGIITGLVVAYFIHNLFVFDNLVSYVFIIMLFAYIHIKATVHINIENHSHNNNFLPAVILVGIVTIALPFVVNGKAYMASNTLIDALVETRSALQAGPTNNQALPLLEKGLESFKKAFSYKTFSDTEILEQLTETTGAINRSTFSDQIKNSFIELTIGGYEKQLSLTPDARGYILYGSFLAQIGKLEEAEASVTKAHELSPNKQAILFTLAQIYAAQGKNKEALEAYKKAYELDTNFDEARLMYAMILAKSGNKTESAKLLEGVSKETLLNKRFLNSYIAIGRYDLVANIYEQIVKEQPENIQNHVSLAAAYLEAGERNKSIEVLNNIITLFPDYAPQIKKLISEIRAGRNPIQK